jgi:hypothetical protein
MRSCGFLRQDASGTVVIVITARLLVGAVVLQAAENACGNQKERPQMRLDVNEWQWRVSLGLGIALLSSLVIPADAGPTARISESGQVLELEYEAGGRVYTDTIPLYRSDKLRYFSAGVGIEE